MDTMESSTNNIATFEEKRSRTVSNAVEGADGEGVDCSHSSKVDDVEICCAGIRGKYSGEINEDGKPNGNGSFVRDTKGMPFTYIGTWKDGEKVGNGGDYTNGRLLGNVVWD